MSSAAASGRTAAPSTKTVRKTNKLLEIVPDDSLRNAIAFLDETYYSDNASAEPTLPKPQHLRADLDSRLVALHASFLKQFAAVNASFNEVSQTVASLEKECQAAKHQLDTVAHSARDLTATAEMLQAEYDEIRQREEQVARFMAQFQLSREESDILKEDVSPKFLAVLQKVQRIQTSCRAMVLPEQQQAAIEIQETMYLAQVAAVEKLVRFLTHHVADIFAADSPAVSNFLATAIACLRAHPGPWEKTMLEITRIRRTSVMRRFMNRIAAANHAPPAEGASSSSSLHHHRGSRRHNAAAVDVARLAGDLCAWLHQAIAEDSDTLQPFFSETGPAVAAASDFSASATAFVPPLTKLDVLDQIFEGTCRHLRERIQSALADAGCTSVTLHERADPEAILTLFKVEGLLGFYLGTTEALIGTHAALSECLRGLRLEALRLFLEGLQEHVRRTVSVAGGGVMPPSLAVSPDTQALLQLLKTMMDHLQGSFVPHQQREVDFAPVLSAVLDPLINAIDVAQVPGHIPADLRESARDVFRVNVLCAVLALILPYDFALPRQKKLTTTLENILVDFTERNATTLDTTFGLSRRIEELRAFDPSTSGSAFDESALKDTATSLYAFVYNVDALAVPLLENIATLRIRDRLRVDVIRRLCAQYTVLYATVGEKIGAERQQQILYHTPDQMYSLMDVPNTAGGAPTAAARPPPPAPARTTGDDRTSS